MSKAIRIRDHLYEEIQRLASENRRSLIGQLELLLEQAIKLPENYVPPTVTITPELAAEIEKLPARADQADPHFKPDFK